MRLAPLVLAVLALSAFVGCQSKPMVVSESGSGSEGIKVHGDWTVEVTNPDGSLATRKQFTNYFNGKHIVAALLSHNVEMERKMSFVFHDSASKNSPKSNGYCGDAPPFNDSEVPANAIHAPNDAGVFYNSVWNGSCTAVLAGDESKFIHQVSTTLKTTPAVQHIGGATEGHMMSWKVLDEPIEVWDGQVIAATVIFSVE